MNEQQEYYGTQETARLLGVSIRTVQLWVEKGLLEAWKTAGGHRRISKKSVDQLLRSRHGTSETPDSDTPAKLSILIIEDDPTVQAYYEALINILEPEASVRIAADGYEGLIALGESHPRLLLLDVDMPQMDGIQLIQRLNRMELPEMPEVAVVTGLNEEQLNERGGVPADIPVYTKPLSIDNLTELLEQLNPAALENAS